MRRTEQTRQSILFKSSYSGASVVFPEALAHVNLTHSGTRHRQQNGKTRVTLVFLHYPPPPLPLPPTSYQPVCETLLRSFLLVQSRFLPLNRPSLPPTRIVPFQQATRTPHTNRKTHHTHFLHSSSNKNHASSPCALPPALPSPATAPTQNRRHLSPVSHRPDNVADSQCRQL